MPVARAAAASGDALRLADARPIPIEYFQGLTHDRAGARYFDGVTVGLLPDGPLRCASRPGRERDPARGERSVGFNHIGDPTWDAAEGGRLILPLECFTPGAPNGGNTCGQGGSASPTRPRSAGAISSRSTRPTSPRRCGRRSRPTGPRMDVERPRPARLSHGGRLAANAAAACAIRPAVRVRRRAASGVTGAAFLERAPARSRGRPRGPLQLWSVDVRTGARELEAELAVSGESEGLDVVDDGHGLVHWDASRRSTRAAARRRTGPATPSCCRSSRAADSRLRMTVAPVRLRAGRAATLRVRVTLRFGGRGHVVAGARVRAAGRAATTDARGIARLRVRRAHPGVVRARATKERLRAATVPLAVG